MADHHDDENSAILSIPDLTEMSYRWTAKKARFCYFFARLGNTNEAAERAQVNPATASGWLSDQPIRDEIQKQVRNLLTSQGENEESVIARWAQWADVDIGDYFEDEWNLKSLDDLTPVQRKCIKKVKISQNQFGKNIDIELHDAHKANNDLATMLGILGKSDTADQPPEETAKSIQQMLREMQATDALEPEDASRAADGSKTTH
jgi:hypothetical protein